MRIPRRQLPPVAGIPPSGCHRGAAARRSADPSTATVLGRRRRRGMTGKVLLFAILA